MQQVKHLEQKAVVRAAVQRLVKLAVSSPPTPRHPRPAFSPAPRIAGPVRSAARSRPRKAIAPAKARCYHALEHFAHHVKLADHRMVELRHHDAALPVLGRQAVRPAERYSASRTGVRRIGRGATPPVPPRAADHPNENAAGESRGVSPDTHARLRQGRQSLPGAAQRLNQQACWLPRCARARLALPAWSLWAWPTFALEASRAARAGDLAEHRARHQPRQCRWHS